MRSTQALLVIALALLSEQARAEPLPPRPQNAEHPGSSSYSYALVRTSARLSGRQVDLFAPEGLARAPVVVFGHGQGIPVESYQDTFEHLARKGVAVLFPQFDTGFFDRDFPRMGKDFVSLSAQAVGAFPGRLDPDRMIFSGHSKGAYVALAAAGLPASDQLIHPRAVLALEPAGYVEENLQRVDPRIPVSLTFSEADTIVKESLVREIYERLPSARKQLILVASYRGTAPELPADHFFSLTKAFIFGGRDGITPFHYYGLWPWLMGAASERHADYLYGEGTADTGVDRIRNVLIRSWP